MQDSGVSSLDQEDLQLSREGALPSTTQEML